MENNTVDESLRAWVTYFKKGESKKVRATMKPLYLRGPGELYRYFPFMPDCHNGVCDYSTWPESEQDSQSTFGAKYNICSLCE